MLSCSGHKGERSRKEGFGLLSLGKFAAVTPGRNTKEHYALGTLRARSGSGEGDLALKFELHYGTGLEKQDLLSLYIRMATFRLNAELHTTWISVLLREKFSLLYTLGVGVKSVTSVRPANFAAAQVGAHYASPGRTCYEVCTVRTVLVITAMRPPTSSCSSSICDCILTLQSSFTSSRCITLQVIEMNWCSAAVATQHPEHSYSTSVGLRATYYGPEAAVSHSKEVSFNCPQGAEEEEEEGGGDDHDHDDKEEEEGCCLLLP